MTLRRREPGSWVIANYGAWPVGAGAGAQLLAQVCEVADARGYTLGLVAHNSELVDKVYKRAGFSVTGTRRSGPIEMERRPQSRAEMSLG